jgi:hypothetical protein
MFNGWVVKTYLQRLRAFKKLGIPFQASYCVKNKRFERVAEFAADSRCELRQQWGIGNDEACFLFCGKFESKKHPLELVKAFVLTILENERTPEILIRSPSC